MTVRVYRSDDAGAPTLSYAAGSLTNVLDACLVNGYGAKASSGWTIEFTATNTRVYRAPAGTRRYLRVADTADSATARMRGYGTMSDVNNGTNPYPTDAQVSGGAYVYKSNSTSTTAYRPWILVATDKCFYLFIHHDQLTFAVTTGYRCIYFFGDIESYKPGDTGHSLLIANISTSVGSNYFGTISNTQVALNGHWMYMSANDASPSLAYSKTSDARGGSTTIGNSGTAYPDFITGGLLLAPVFVCEPSNRYTRGHMPGLWAPLHNVPGNIFDTFSGSGVMSGKAFILLDAANATTRGKIALEISDTW